MQMYFTMGKKAALFAGDGEQGFDVQKGCFVNKAL